MTQGVNVDLPDAPSEAITDKNDPLVVSMRGDGALFMNTGAAALIKAGNSGTRVTIFSLQEQAAKILRARPEVPVYIKADQRLTVESGPCYDGLRKTGARAWD